jgi:hypothetical protein
MHEWAKRISEFVLGHGPKPTAKFQQNSIQFIQNVVEVRQEFRRMTLDPISFIFP